MMNKTALHEGVLGHVTGSSAFVDDMPPCQGELFVGVVTSPVAKGILQSISVERALALPNVVKVLTAKDFHKNRWGAIKADQPLLADHELSYWGEPVALVVVNERRALMDAIKAIDLKIESLPPTLGIDAARQNNEYLAEPIKINRGDAPRALKNSPHQLKGIFVSKGQDHFYLESQACICRPLEQGAFEVLSSTQHPSEVQHVVAKALGLSYHQVVCQVYRMGGAFGGKESQASHYAALCAVACQKTGKVCRLVLSKDDDMIATGKRHPFETHWQVGFDQDGCIQAIIADLYSDGGSFLDLSTPIMQRALLHSDNAYYLPNAQLTGYITKTNIAPNTAFRGFGGPQGVMVIESIMEEISDYLGLESLVVRKRNLYQDEQCNSTPYGQTVDPGLGRLVTDLSQNCDYDERLQNIARWNEQHPYKVRALALTPVKFGISFTLKLLNQANALVNIHLDGSIQVSTGATEMGQGVNSKIALLVAESFGISYDHVRVMPTSTEKNHNTSATAASSGTDLNGSAALDACSQLKERLAAFFVWYHQFPKGHEPSAFLGDSTFELIPASYGSRYEDCVEFRDGQVWSRCQKHNMPFATLVTLCYQFRVSLGAYGYYRTKGIHFDWQTGKGQPFLYFTTGAAASEVEIDCLSGDLKVLRTDILMDLGRPIHEGIDRGQVIGGFVQGMGWVTTEDLVYDHKGFLQTHSPTTYKIPNIGDIPRILNVTLLQDSKSPLNVRGSKAVGEPPFLLCASVFAAIKKALMHKKPRKFQQVDRGCGLKLPATGEEILKSLAGR